MKLTDAEILKTVELKGLQGNKAICLQTIKPEIIKALRKLCFKIKGIENARDLYTSLNDDLNQKLQQKNKTIDRSSVKRELWEQARKEIENLRDSKNKVIVRLEQKLKEKDEVKKKIIGDVGYFIDNIATILQGEIKEKIGRKIKKEYIDLIRNIREKL